MWSYEFDFKRQGEIRMGKLNLDMYIRHYPVKKVKRKEGEKKKAGALMPMLSIVDT